MFVGNTGWSKQVLPSCLSCFRGVIAQKVKFSIKDFFSKCDQIRSYWRIWSHWLKKSSMENFIFLCSVYLGLSVTYDELFLSKVVIVTLSQLCHNVDTKSPLNFATTLSTDVSGTFGGDLTKPIQPIVQICDNVVTMSLCFLGTFFTQLH